MATTPRQFRLTDDTLADLDWIAGYLAGLLGEPPSRTTAIRYAIRQMRRQLGEANLSKKKHRKSSKTA